VIVCKYFFATVLLIISTCYPLPVVAQSPLSADPVGAEKVPFYLPYHSSQHPELAKKFDAALAQAGLGDYQTVTTDYWHPYQQGIRQGRVGVYLTAPHFAAWAIRKHKFTPILRLSEPLKYVVAARRDDSQYFEINDLADKAICSQRAVNLDFLLVRTAFGNSFRSAENKIVNSVASAMRYDNQNCDAFSVSEHVFKQFNLKFPDRFIRLQQGPKFNNYAFVLHPQITGDNAARLTKFLTRRKTQKLLRPLFRHFSEKPVLLSIRPQDYPAEYLKPLELYWQ